MPTNRFTRKQYSVLIKKQPGYIQSYKSKMRNFKTICYKLFWYKKIILQEKFIKYKQNWKWKIQNFFKIKCKYLFIVKLNANKKTEKFFYLVIF